MNLHGIRALAKRIESDRLEFKRSTGELKEGMQTLCAFLNGAGGTLLFGIRPNGTIEGQTVADQTLREIAQAMDRFEPPVNVPVERVKVGGAQEVLILVAEPSAEHAPFTFEGRAYERVGSTTRRMPQAKYEGLLLDRAHARRRWENQSAVDVKLKDLDREEILRTREEAIRQRRISAGTGTNIGDILDRVGLRRNGTITQAALVLFGRKFLPDYPQCMLKMGRFRGTTVQADILDNKQEYMNAFAIVREGMAFLDRTLPLAACFPEGQINREDRLPVPPNALREILLNAVMHRDYSDPGGFVAIAVFDDRIEIRSSGALPSGVTVDMLSGPHLSRKRNPLIAETFHRTGAVEIWGRGTNRVIEECKAHGIAAPTFEVKQGWVVVTFRAAIVPEQRMDTQGQLGTQKTTQKTAQKSAQKGAQKSAQKIIDAIGRHVAITIDELSSQLAISPRAVKNHLHNLKKEGRLKRIGPDKGGHWEVVR